MQSSTLRLDSFLQVLERGAVMVNSSLLHHFLRILSAEVVARPFPHLRSHIFQHYHRHYSIQRFVRRVVVVQSSHVRPYLLRRSFQGPSTMKVTHPTPERVTFLFIMPIRRHFTRDLCFLNQPRFSTNYFRCFYVFQVYRCSTSYSFSSV